MKPPVTEKLAGGSHYGASLLWMSLFGSSQPCGWLTGKIEAKQKLHKQAPPTFFSNLSQKF